MSRIVVALLTIVLFAASSFTVNAAQFGTRDEAVALVKRVQETFKKQGPEATFRIINSGAFNDRDLYPFVHTIDGTLHVANGAWPGIRGKNLHDMRDQNGKYTTQDFMRIASTSPYHGWSDFRWRNPKTNTVDEKSAWIERMGEYLIGVGIYKSEQPNQIRFQSSPAAPVQMPLIYRWRTIWQRSSMTEKISGSCQWSE